MAAAAAVDVETTGLDPARHVAWDIAIVTGDARHQWFVKPDLATADPFGLRVGKFYERTADLLPPLSRKQGKKWADPAKAAAQIARLLNGATLVGHNPAFDAAFIGAFLRRHGQILTADHHQIDTGTLVTGYIHGCRRGWRESGKPASQDQYLQEARYPLPKGKHLSDMARALGIDPMGYEQHTALGDALLAMAVYDVVMGGAS